MKTIVSDSTRVSSWFSQFLLTEELPNQDTTQNVLIIRLVKLVECLHVRAEEFIWNLFNQIYHDFEIDLILGTFVSKYLVIYCLSMIKFVDNKIMYKIYFYVFFIGAFVLEIIEYELSNDCTSLIYITYTWSLYNSYFQNSCINAKT